mmetsp:Transcript_62234/g.122995  ORF Transcript_62234/g.122995 Transcript_62234/m.122995 type:complete len:96 (-) Transcript_62234:359-646(-)
MERNIYQAAVREEHQQRQRMRKEIVDAAIAARAKGFASKVAFPGEITFSWWRVLLARAFPSSIVGNSAGPASKKFVKVAAQPLIKVAGETAVCIT